jgi:uncharacterized protein (DUF488 family)
MSRKEGSPARTVAEGLPDGAPRLLTLGYEGRDLAEVLEILRRHAIEQVLDVRENASSKKAGFAEDDLKEALAGIGIAYAHLSELGCARESRHALWRGGEERLFREEYRRRLAERPAAFDDLVRRVRSARTLVLCLERDPARCHRAVLTERLRAEGIESYDL